MRLEIVIVVALYELCHDRLLILPQILEFSCHVYPIKILFALSRKLIIFIKVELSADPVLLPFGMTTRVFQVSYALILLLDYRVAKKPTRTNT